jgi:hypothetical protein
MPEQTWQQPPQPLLLLGFQQQLMPAARFDTQQLLQVQQNTVAGM